LPLTLLTLPCCDLSSCAQVWEAAGTVVNPLAVVGALGLGEVDGRVQGERDAHAAVGCAARV
jgi:hypothetical protein